MPRIITVDIKVWMYINIRQGREKTKNKKHVCSVFRDLATVFLQPVGGNSTKNGFSFFLEKCLAMKQGKLHGDL